jgi:hypothetical protein
MTDSFFGGAPPERDFWDKLDILGKFFSAVVIGVATIAIGFLYHSEEEANRKAEGERAEKQHQSDQSIASSQNEYTAKTQRLAAVTTLIPLIKSGGNDQKAALALISFYGDPAVKLQLAGIYPGDAGITAAASRSLDASAAGPLSAVQLQQSGKALNEGWVYLGEYGPEGAPQKSWKTHYLEFDASLEPKALAGKTYRVRDETGALYIRDSLPGSDGTLGKPVGGIQSGQHVCVRSVSEWQQSGFLWANVRLVTGSADTCQANKQPT